MNALLAATNRPEILDPALLRPGRFDRQIPVTNPDLAGREQILRVHAKNKPLAEEVDVAQLAKRTAGMSGADLANVLNEAALLTARIGGNVITYDALEEATDRVKGAFLDLVVHATENSLRSGLKKDDHSAILKRAQNSIEVGV